MEQIETLQRLLAQPACRMIVGGFRPPSDPFTSWFGRVCVAQAQESWPIFEGKPMIALCQINCSDLLVRPEPLISVGFLTLFVAADRLLSSHTANGKGWVLRTYRVDQPLNLLENPPSLESAVKGFPIRWELIEQDYPCWEDALDILGSKRDLADQDLLHIFEEYHEQRELFPTHFCSKIGGWPSLIQSSLFNSLSDKPAYVFQIDSESKAHWGWGDNGIGYFGCIRGLGQSDWFLDWQQL